MDSKRISRKSIYRIRLKGWLDHPSMDWFNGFTILKQEKDETVLVGSFVDQSALRGFLDQLWNLNYTILSVEEIGNESV